MKKVFAANLRKVRHQLGWKSSLIASKNLGINRPTYQAYEEGRSMPNVEGLAHLAAVMGITNLGAFICDPGFDYRSQGTGHKFKEDPIVLTNYRVASERDRKLVDAILEIPAQ